MSRFATLGFISLQTADNKIFAAYIQCRGGVYPHPRCCGVFALYLVRCWQGWDNPSPYARQSAAMQHKSNVGVGFIPTLAAAGYLLCILSAVGRTGINLALAAAGHLL